MGRLADVHVPDDVARVVATAARGACKRAQLLALFRLVEHCAVSDALDVFIIGVSLGRLRWLFFAYRCHREHGNLLPFL